MTKKIRNSKGFTLIEMLMVILLVAILAAVAIPQFLDFQVEARNAATQANLGALRTSIANQYAQQIMRCGAATDEWPLAASIEANNIELPAGLAPCDGAGFAGGQQQFMASGIPVNPWGDPGVATVTVCDNGSCDPANDGAQTACDGTGTFTGGWCYNEDSGAIWADSANNPNNDESTF